MYAQPDPRPRESETNPRPAQISRRTFALGAGTAMAAALASGPPARATAASPGNSTGGGADVAESVVFEAGEDGLEVFHVFGLTATPAGTVLAFAEGRITQHDADPHHIACRRSTDGGRTWGELRYVRRSDGTQSFVNPTPVVDTTTGRVHLFHAECFRDPGNTGGSPDRSRVYVVTSDDDGRTWSDPTDVTSLFDENPHEWTLHMPGPGHGTQLSDGRLLMPVWHRRAIAYPVPERRYGVSVVVLDPGAETWHAAGGVPLDGAYPVNESRVVERPDGSIALFGRYAAGGIHPRIVSVSTDGGRTWSDPVLDAAARPVNAVDTGVTRISGGPGSDAPSRIAFSRPDSPRRRNLTVSISYDEGASWPFNKVLTDGPASYSDIVALPGGRIGVLYGRDHADGVTPSFSRTIAFATFDVAWLTDGTDTPRSGPPVRLSAEFEDLPFLAGPRTDLAANVVEDAAASGGRRVELAAADYGDYVEAPVDVEHTAHYDVYVRFRHLPNGGVVAVTIDGERIGGTVDTSTVSVRSFKTEHLGGMRLRRGQHTVRLSAVDKHVDSSGLRISPDLITLIARDGATSS
ncbi:exo-alpha-sialidase [Phytoactinopolyspora halotolerans]|uniref:exo-alpha-sialidase n=1 Tax=Phytoactinopolyspora halotolerans TaxID=1981512 RepID=A0A6L9S526_9ACTN|nr:exo-alpha-sialidase [Phytoactinopolyspora halotolerans]NEE00083.1 hypothetical protein [Phytoactinopolyspora halotolerans]